MRRKIQDLAILEGIMGSGMVIGFLIHPGPSLWVGFGFFVSVLMTYGVAHGMKED